MLVSHGTMAEGMYQAAKMVFGDIKEVACLCLSEDKDIEIFRRELRLMLETLNREEPITVLCDIGGGSPYNTALELLADAGCMEQVTVISGMNLPLLILLLLGADGSRETVRKCVEEAKGSLQIFEMPGEEEDEDL